MKNSVRPYLVLIRPANVITSVTDVLAGVAIASSVVTPEWKSALLLVLSSACLYSGGIVFNDFFDRKIDKEERPERPIPSGKISARNAVIFGITLFAVALTASLFVNTHSLVLSASIMTTALLYDRWMKHNAFFGPLFMGVARGLNLLLGISISFRALEQNYWLAVIPLIFIASITLTSREENKGNNKTALLIAMILDICVVALLIFAAFMFGGLPWAAILLALLWAIMVFSAKWKAFLMNTPENIKNAVKTGVMSLMVMDACYALMASNYGMAVVIISLLPVSILLARKFAVT